MTNVLDFPASRVRGGCLPLSTMSEALEMVIGGTTDWRNSDAQHCMITDSAGVAALFLAKAFSDAIHLSMRLWNGDTSAFETKVCCYLRMAGSQINGVFSSNDGAALNRDLRSEIDDVLVMAVERLKAGTIVRIIN